MHQGSPGHKLEDNPVLSELDWDEADLDEELHKAGGGEQEHGLWELIFSVSSCQAKPSQLVYVAKLEELWTN